MPFTSEAEESLLGPWPPRNWRENPDVAGRFPLFDLRRDLLMALDALHRGGEPGCYPATPVREIVDLMADAGPPVDERSLPMIEAVLDGLWREGQVGRVPAPSPHDPDLYMSLEAAEVAASRGLPALLLPLVGPRPWKPRPRPTLRPPVPVRVPGETET